MSNVGASLIGLIPTILVLGVLVAMVKTFQGKEYQLDETFKSKAAADKRARELRKEDYKARVSRESTNGKSVWAVYKRDEGGFSFF